MRSYQILSSAHESSWGSGGRWFFVTAILSLLPVWGGLCFFALFGQVELKGFVDHGEFAIYSAGLLTSALLVIFSDYTEPFPNRTFWGLITFVLLILATLVFGAVAATQQFPALGDELDLRLVRILSLMLYILTFLVTLLLTVLDKSMPGLEPIETRRAGDLGELEAKFKALGGGQ